MSNDSSRLWRILLSFTGISVIGFLMWELSGVLALPLVVILLISTRVLPPQYAFAVDAVLVAALVGETVTSTQAIGLAFGLGALIGAESIRNDHFDVRTVIGFLTIFVVASGAVVSFLESSGFALVALVVAVTTAVSAYGLHRYELVTLDLLTET
ncbi:MULTISPECIES: hypothetical protein [Haloferax]|uniref:DUF8163 domain-containing protein n=1 Tax=Haloferax marinum TaxID=2666143 RepID=A0A6A8G9P0_9EURY|nr:MULTISPECIES: hypothetical protein [Haloferax]KAB1198228.1 hypothetical protein Hfx1150_12180 [Haloferax sp. CBA1150]MRW97318.1 hypothetical protein [Haloferax marinum]